jgi:hypothetical protein
MPDVGTAAADKPASEPAPASAAADARPDVHLHEFLQTISHIRHDWMNDMQVLSGYIQLKKYDYLPPYMEKIRLRLQNESALGKLGVPSLIAYLLTFRTGCRAFELELEFPQEIHIAEMPLPEDIAERTIRYVLEAFRRHSKDYVSEPNVLTLEFAQEDDGLLLDFAYNGQYDAEGLGAELRSPQLADAAPDLYIEACELEEGLVSLAIRLPFAQPNLES